jgi:dihydrofolate synthase/folylpolyglutamate synthase
VKVGEASGPRPSSANLGGALVKSTRRGGRPPLSYQRALAWLYELQRFGIKLGLETTRRLLAERQAEPGDARVIHVAGTNGKGSVCAMIESIARASGRRTGLFTSPHLVTFRERIRVNGAMISEEAVADGLNALQNLIKKEETPPTFFEITTVLALKHFSNEKVDVVVLETGMGGRLDSTNAVQSAASVITSIGLDHQKWLGQTVREIAFEKAGIIKQGTPVISAPQPPEAGEVIRARATDCAASLEYVQEPYELSPVALRGAHQKQNAALALAAIRAAGIDVDQASIARGLASVEWPARFQRWDEHTIIDGAHNPAAARVLTQTWREIFGDQRATLIFAVLSDKDVRGIVEALAPIADRILLPKIRSERALAPEELAEIISSITPKLQCSIAPSLAEALDAARAKLNPILITGSLHFAGEALAHLKGIPAAFEECAQ